MMHFSNYTAPDYGKNLPPLLALQRFPVKLASNVLWQQETNYLDLLTKIYNEASYPATYEIGHKKKQIFLPIMQQMALRGGRNHINKTIKTVDQRVKSWRAGYITDLHSSIL